MIDRVEIETWLLGFQERFAAGVEALDARGIFITDGWKRDGGGGGVTRILSDGAHVEKAAVNFSAVHGSTPPALSEGLASGSERFYATGVSIIVHPVNPHAPTFHANLRYLETVAGGDGKAWFGGGADLTPYYLYPEDAHHFHRVLAGVCSRHAVADHAAWKRRCDEYFYLAHRGEARGIGGLFYDHLTDRLDDVWALQRDLGDHLLEAYVPILERRIHTAYDDCAQRWHEIRRGRYTEFNLVWDRGTRFGLETGGRTESILASLPPRARWEYAHEPDPGSPESELLGLLRGKPRDWASWS